MDRHHGFCARRDRRLDSLGLDVERDRIDVDEHRARPHAHHRSSCRKERVRGRDDLVARLDIQRHQRDEQRIGAGRHGDRVIDFEQFAELHLKGVDFGPHDEPLAVADARNRREHLVADRRVLGLQVEQRHLHRTRLFTTIADS